MEEHPSRSATPTVLRRIHPPREEGNHDGERFCTAKLTVPLSQHAEVLPFTLYSENGGGSTNRCSVWKRWLSQGRGIRYRFRRIVKRV